MHPDLQMLIEVCEQGLIFSLAVMAVFISSRTIHFDDLTVDGSFSIGGALTAAFLVAGLHPLVCVGLAILGGCFAGFATGVLHTKMQINPLISGICVTTAAFSINLKLTGSNLALGQLPTVLKWGANPHWTILATLGGIVFLAWSLLRWFLNTEAGFMVKAAGDNPQMVVSLGKDPRKFKVLALVIANGLTALAGSLFVQWTGFFSITGGIGTLIIALTGLILSEVFSRSFGISLLLGAIACQAIFAGTIELGIDPSWNNLIKAVMIVCFIQLKSRPLKATLAR
jgi:putative ABC transport system permease protein